MKSQAHFCVLFPFLVFSIWIQFSSGQLTPTETRILLRVQQLLEYPPVLQGWNNGTSFCYLPPSDSLVVACDGNRVTNLTIVGNKSSNSTVSQKTLSPYFSIDAFFTTLTKLSNLKALSLVSLGLWGPLPAKVNRFSSLEVLNISSNFISNEIPPSVASMKNLKTLVLSDNLFNGSIPDLSSLSVLEQLDLGYNQIGPQFPSLNKSIVILVLKNNSIRSEIPSQLKSFNLLQQLDISYNKFMGPIPSFLFSLPSIKYINLESNQLTGAIPTNTSCNEKLTFIDISHNLLFGNLPFCMEKNDANWTVLTSWNCLSSGNSNYQHPYAYCHREALAVKPPSLRNQEKSNSIRLGLILGVIGGVVVAAAAFGLLIFALFRISERKKCENHGLKSIAAKKTGVANSRKPPVFHSRYVPQRMKSGTVGLPAYHVFNLEEMEDATNNFEPSNLIGDEFHEQLYKGWLRDGSVVVVKCVKLKQRHSAQSLTQIIETVSKLRHRNLVSIIGHCTVTYQEHPNMATTIFIVFENISNGSLRNHLTERRKREVLKWPQRMAITIGIARGIQFLHTGIAPGIFGNDLNIENVLLDESLSPRISIYNIPLFSEENSESLRDESAANLEKDDIYNFGVILLEIITGKPVTSNHELEYLQYELEKSLTEAPSKLRAVSDPSIQGTFAYESLKTTVQITVNCLSKDSSKRPSIEDVLWNLQYSFQVQEGWNSSGNLSSRS